MGPPEAPIDLIADPQSLARWLRLAAEVHPELRAEAAEAGHPDDGDAARLRRVRDHAAAAIEAARHGRPPEPSALQVLTDAQRAAPALWVACWEGEGMDVAERREGAPGARLAAHLAAAAARFLGEDSLTRVRRCAGEGCVLLFVAAHPRRRWCSASRCGNRARVARYYRRHHGRADDDAPDARR